MRHELKPMVQDMTEAEVRWAVAQARQSYRNRADELWLRCKNEDEEALVNRQYAAHMTACSKALTYLLEGINEGGGLAIWNYDWDTNTFLCTSATQVRAVHTVVDDECGGDCKAFINGAICWHRTAARAVFLFHEELERRGFKHRRPIIRKSREQVQAEADELFPI